MNQRSDTDRVLRHWLADGPSQMPDRILDVVADRITRQPQRRIWRLLGRLTMTPAFKYGLAVAAVIVKRADTGGAHSERGHRPTDHRHDAVHAAIDIASAVTRPPSALGRRRFNFATRTAHHPPEQLDDVPDGRPQRGRRWIETS